MNRLCLKKRFGNKNIGGIGKVGTLLQNYMNQSTANGKGIWNTLTEGLLVSDHLQRKKACE